MAEVRLRAFEEGDLPFLDRLCTDPDALGPFAWAGFVDARVRRRRWQQDGYVGMDSAALAVVAADGTVAGIASWDARCRGGPYGTCYEIGFGLLPEHRGRGLGTAGQRLLVDHLFAFTAVHRLEALADVDNVAEHRVLDRIGFRREGVLRGCLFRAGAWRDLAVYARLRADAQAGG